MVFKWGNETQSGVRVKERRERREEKKCKGKEERRGAEKRTGKREGKLRHKPAKLASLSKASSLFLPLLPRLGAISFVTLDPQLIHLHFKFVINFGH